MEHDVKEVIAKLDDTIYILKEVEELVALSKRRKELRKTIILSLRISDDLYNQEDYIIRKRLDHYPGEVSDKSLIELGLKYGSGKVA